MLAVGFVRELGSVYTKGYKGYGCILNTAAAGFKVCNLDAPRWLCFSLSD